MDPRLCSSGKNWHEEEWTARLALLRSSMEPAPDGSLPIQSYYRCEECNHFHLSSKPVIPRFTPGSDWNPGKDLASKQSRR